MVDLSDIEDWEDICRECRRAKDEEDPCSTCAVNRLINGGNDSHIFWNNSSIVESDNGYRVVSKSSNRNFINTDKCETKTDQTTLFHEKREERPNSYKCERPLSKSSHLGSHLGNENKSNDEVTLSWITLMEKIKSGKDKPTLTILNCISKNNGRIAHRIIAKRLNVDRTTVTKRINYLERIGILERIPSRPRRYIIDSKFIRILNGDISHLNGRGIQTSQNGYFRIHGFQRVFLMVNFHIPNVNSHILRDLIKRYGWVLTKVIKRRGWESYIFYSKDHPAYKVELNKRTLIVSSAFKTALKFDWDEFPDDPEEMKDKLLKQIKRVAEDFEKALGGVFNTSISIIDRGWAGENPVSPKAKKKEVKRINKPEVAYIDPDGIIHKVEERYGKFYIEGLGWFIDKSIKTEAELEFKNTKDHDSIENACNFKRVMNFLAENADAQKGLKIIGQNPLLVASLGGTTIQNTDHIIREMDSKINQTLLKKNRELEQELKKIREEYESLKRELKQELIEIRKFMIEELRAIKEMISKDIQETMFDLETKVVRESTTNLNTVAVAWNRIIKLEEIVKDFVSSMKKIENELEKINRIGKD